MSSLKSILLKFLPDRFIMSIAFQSMGTFLFIHFFLFLLLHICKSLSTYFSMYSQKSISMLDFFCLEFPHFQTYVLCAFNSCCCSDSITHSPWSVSLYDLMGIHERRFSASIHCAIDPNSFSGSPSIYFEHLVNGLFCWHFWWRNCLSHHLILVFGFYGNLLFISMIDSAPSHDYVPACQRTLN